MSEIEKMYENAGVGYLMYVVDTFPPVEYPQIDFTAEKQLELIKWLAIKGDFNAYVDIAKNTYNYWTIYFGGGRWTAEGFEETLAGLINLLWQYMTDTEKAEIKEILG